LDTRIFCQQQLKKNRPKYVLSTQLRDFEIVAREYARHPEAKSPAPDGSPCTASTLKLLRRRPIRALLPFRYIGKEVDRQAQNDVNVPSDVKPLEYQSDGEKLIEKPGQNRYTAHVVEQQLEKLPVTEQACRTGLDRNTIRRARRGERVHMNMHMKLLKLASS
jgi:hypothetical protein